MTGQSLFYKGKDGLKNKLMVIEEDEGMKDAIFSIRILLSKQKLHLQGLKTDQQTGEMRDYENVVEGPASVFIATTDQAAFDHEALNRFLIVYLDESPEQTKRILEHLDRMDTLQGLEIRENQKHIASLHQNIQRLLKPVVVLNPVGTGLNYPPEILHSRREKTKLQTLIKVVALLHQHQRPRKTRRIHGKEIEYIEVTQADVDAVHRYAGDILRHSLDDLSKLCRELLRDIHDLVDDKYRAQDNTDDKRLERWEIVFTRKELMDRCGWSMWHLREHLEDLVERGYLVERRGKQGQRYAYSLVIDDIPELPTLT
jgi:hypothetical protein